MQSSETVVRKASYADVIRTPKRNNNKTSRNTTIKSGGEREDSAAISDDQVSTETSDGFI
jgi:hypothetical protein